MDASTWDCLSCGASAQHKPFCEGCGAARPVEGAEDSALSLMLGLVCERCDGYNDPGVDVCASCGAALGVDAPAAAADASPPPAPPAPVAAATTEPAATRPAVAEPPSWMTPPTGRPLATAFALPKVDLAAVASSAEGAGLAAPRPAVSAPATTSPPTVPSPGTTGTSPAPAAVASPATATALVTPPCAKCATPLSPADRFCRNCGTRVGDGVQPSASGPVATMQIAALKMPAPGLPSPMLPAGATMAMPAVRTGGATGGGLGGSASPAGGAPSATMFFGAATAERVAKLVLVRGVSQFGSQWRLQAGETTLGRSQGAVLFPDDENLAERHCRFVFRGPDLWLEPEQTTNGVFLRVRGRAKVGPGDEIVVGAQRLRLLADEDRPMKVEGDATTKTLGSMVKSSPPIALLRVAPDPAQNEVFFRCQRLLTLGRNHCDVNFPRDSFVSERHAQLSFEEDGLVLEDLRSRNGTYTRVRQPMQLQHGDLVLLGDKVLRIELPQR